MLMADPNQKKIEFDALRDDILAHVREKKAFEKPRKTYIKLQSLKSPKWMAEWQEVMILFNCSLRARPGLTHRQLCSLSDTRKTQNEEVRFEGFLSVIKDMLHPDTLTSHGYTKTFSSLDADKIYNSIHLALAPLSQLGYPIILFAGSLLGAIRDGKLIDHDDDIDMAIFLGECSAEEIPLRVLEFKKKLAENKLITAREAEKNTIWSKLITNLGVQVDLFPCWTEDGLFSAYPYSSLDISEDSVFPLGSFDMDPVMIPAKPEVLLEQCYGKGWKIPDPMFSVKWGELNKGFPTLFSQDYTLSAQDYKLEDPV